MVTDEGESDSSWGAPTVIPMPPNGTSAGEIALLLTMESTAARSPSPAGVKVTCTEQLAFGASDAGQLLVSRLARTQPTGRTRRVLPQTRQPKCPPNERRLLLRRRVKLPAVPSRVWTQSRKSAEPRRALRLIKSRTRQRKLNAVNRERNSFRRGAPLNGQAHAAHNRSRYRDE